MNLVELPLGLPGKVFRSQMPFGRFDPAEEVYEEFERAEIDIIVLLVEEYEYRRITGRDLKSLYIEDGYEVIHFPILDFSVPAKEELAPVVEKAVRLAGQGKNMVVHCHAGIGRAGLFLAAMAKKALGLSGEEAIRFVRSHVPFALETSEQRRFVISCC